MAVIGVLIAGCAAPAPPSVPPDPLPVTSAGTPSWTPWPSAQHDARHSGASSTDGPTTGSVRWRRELGAGISSGPVVARDGTIYAAANDGVLHAIDPATGSDRWTVAAGSGTGGDLSTSPLVLPDGTVLVGAGGPELVAVSAAGAVVWRVGLPGTPTSPVTVDGTRVYVGDRGGHVSAVDVTAHRRVWTVGVGPSSYGSVVTDGAGRLYTTSGSSLVAVDDRGDTGAVAWTADPHDGITEVSAGLGPDGTVLLGTNGRREWAYHRDGTPAWNTPRVITYSSPGVTADGLAYVADHSGRVQVLSVSDGTVRATYQLEPPQQIWTAVAVDRSHRAYFGTLDGRLVGLAPDGSPLLDVTLGSSVYGYPALTGDGAVVAGSRDGVLVAVG